MTTAAVASYFKHQSSTPRFFAEHFPREPFVFAHDLSSHELLELCALKKLAQKQALNPLQRGFFAAPDAEGLRWGTEAMRQAISTAFRDMEASATRIKLSRIHGEPGYSEIFRQCTIELSELTGIDLERPAREPLETIFISSPHEVTPYHIDECENFLLQIHGSKVVFVYDGRDRDVLSWRDLEDYYAGNTRLEFPPASQARPLAFELRPGLALYNPVNFPHSVENGPEVSVSVSLGYTKKSNPFGVLRINHSLRKVGISPRPPGESPMRDAAKLLAFNMMRFSKGLLKTSQSEAPPERY